MKILVREVQEPPEWADLSESTRRMFDWELTLSDEPLAKEFMKES